MSSDDFCSDAWPRSHNSDVTRPLVDAYHGETTEEGTPMGVKGFDFGRTVQGKRVEDAKDDLVNHSLETNKCQYIAH